jgi:hypothetical protein
MRASQSLWTAQQGWTGKSEGKADLLLAFGGPAAVTNKRMWDDVLRRHQGAATDCAELHNQTMTITVFGERTGA